MPLTPGVAFTLEPGMLVEGSDEKLIVHEENCVITENGCEWYFFLFFIYIDKTLMDSAIYLFLFFEKKLRLSDRAPRKMVSILDGDETGAYKVFTDFEQKAMVHFRHHMPRGNSFTDN